MKLADEQTNNEKNITSSIEESLELYIVPRMEAGVGANPKTRYSKIRGWKMEEDRQL